MKPHSGRRATHKILLAIAAVIVTLATVMGGSVGATGCIGPGSNGTPTYDGPLERNLQIDFDLSAGEVRHGNWQVCGPDERLPKPPPGHATP